MISWHTRFIDLAKTVSTWSKDPSTQVGAVIVDPKRRVVGLGYNGFPRGVEDTEERLNDRPVKYSLVVHAESNAILNSTTELDGCSIYVWPLPPCNECAKLIIQSGITEVYFSGTGKAMDRWKDHEVALSMLNEAGLKVRMVPQ